MATNTVAEMTQTEFKEILETVVSWNAARSAECRASRKIVAFARKTAK